MVSNRRSKQGTWCWCWKLTGKIGGAKKGKETPAHNVSFQPPRILCSEIHLGWETLVPPGRTWVRTTTDQARWLVRDTPETKPITVDASYMAEWFSWVSFPFCSPPRHPLPNKVSCFVSLCCLLGRFTSECQTRAHSWALEGVPLPVTIYGLYLATLLPNTINPISQFETILVRSQTKMHIHSKKQRTQPWHTCNKETRGGSPPA